jgi:anti-anti-sigma factor
LVVEGEIDSAHERRFCQTIIDLLDETDVDQVVVDLSGVTFIASSGVRALLSAQAHAGDRALIIRDPSARAARTLAIAGVTDILRIVG